MTLMQSVGSHNFADMLNINILSAMLKKKAIQHHVFHEHIQNEFVICWVEKKIHALYSLSKTDSANAKKLPINRIRRRSQPSNHFLMMQLKKKIRPYIYIHRGEGNEQHDIWGKWRYVLNIRIQRVCATWRDV